MKNFVINKESLFKIDSALEGQDLKQYDLEIENIVNNLWKGIGEFEEMLSPFFTNTLKNELLPSLYINYLSLVKLEEKYENINVKATTSIIDIIGKNLNFKLDPNRTNYDLELNLRGENFFKLHQKTSDFFWKRTLRKIRGQVSLYWAKLNGIEVLFMNAGKLKKDFSMIPNSLDAIYIYQSKSKQVMPNIESIKNVVKKNIYGINLSIPSELVIELIEQKIFKYLYTTLNRIFILAEFIDKHKVKLVISSAATHEAFLCLLAAAKLAKIDSLIIPHGFVTNSNPKLDNYCTYQGTINDFEPRYKGVHQIRFKTYWFGKKI